MSASIVLDTSAVVAILLREPDGTAIKEALLANEPRGMSALTVLEAAMVLEARIGPGAPAVLDRFLEIERVEVFPFTSEQLRLARDAWRRFGNGRHSAKLNLGDCCSYALARHLGRPLLCKGDDFPLTDLPLVPY